MSLTRYCASPGPAGAVNTQAELRYKLVDVAVAAKKVQLSDDLLDLYKYWVLKRVAGGNKPLLPPKGEDEVLNAL